MPSPTYRKKIEKRIEKATKAFEEQLSKIAEEVREQLVIPICRKRGLIFLSGNADFFFCDEHVHYADSLNSEAPADVRRALKVLETEITHANYLGFYVESVPTVPPDNNGPKPFIERSDK